jgi:hypothetical protein
VSNVVGSIPQLAHNEKGVGATPGDFQRFQVLVVLIDDRLPPAFLGARASGPHWVGWPLSIGVPAHYPVPRQRGCRPQCADERDAVIQQRAGRKAPSEPAKRLPPLSWERGPPARIVQDATGSHRLAFQHTTPLPASGGCPSNVLTSVMQ